MQIRYEMDDVHRRVTIPSQGPFEPADLLNVFRGGEVRTSELRHALHFAGHDGRPHHRDSRKFMREDSAAHEARGSYCDRRYRPGIKAGRCT